MSQIEVKRKQIQSIISIVGVVTWLILGRLMGYSGIAYLGAAMETVAILLTLLSGSVADVVGKLIRNRNAKGQYRNADKIKSSIFIFQGILSVIGGLLVLLLGGLVTERLFMIPNAALALSILSPALILRVITVVFLGYFQGSGAQMPTVAVSGIRQIMYLGLGVLFVNILMEYGEKVKALLLNDTLPAMYAAAGVAIAVTVTEVLLLLAVVLTYIGSRKSREKQEEGLKKTETFFSAVGNVYRGRGGLTLSELFFRIPIILGLVLYMKNATDVHLAVTQWGKFYGGYLMICMLPILLGETMLHSLGARIAATVRKGEQRYAGRLFGAAFHSALAYTLPIAVFVAVMSSQVSVALAVSGEQSQAIAGMLRIGSSIIVLAVTASLFLRVLLYVGKTNLVLIASVIYAIVFTVAALIGVSSKQQSIDGLIYAMMIALAVICLLIGVYLVRVLRAPIDFIYCIGIPAAGALGCGILCYLLSTYITPHLGYTFTMILALILSIVVYVLVLLFFKSFKKHEMEVIPGGKLLKIISDSLHIE